ncbi:hypothetical protein BDW22DRAFT_1402971 [Trametopsis cervina]|nr:hypothetical protein BDW22DRAFT_1402971 [Trametopsis cervina]
MSSAVPAGPSNPPGPSSPSVPPATAPNAQDVPTSLEQLVQFLTLGHEIGHVHQTLKSFTKDPRDSVLADLLSSGQDPLDLLHPETHTLGFLYILSTRLNIQGAAPIQQSTVETFCRSFNPEQARLAPTRITALAKGIVRASGDNLKFALSSLRDLVTRYPPNLSYLTTLHPIFLNICVITRHYSAALPIVSVPILNVDTSLSDLHYNDSLLYHYAGGVALGALKRWREAEEFFEIVATAPAQVPAAIQLEALKKLTLVQLILYGKTQQSPKYTSPVIIRLLKNSPYLNLAKMYPQHISILGTLPPKDEELFKVDKNWGLVQQVIARAPRWLIKKLTLTYLTLGLSDIALQIGVHDEDEVRALVIDMVESGDISASISVDGTVTFSDSVAQLSKSEIDHALAQAQAQSQLLVQLEREMNLSKEYIAKALKHKEEAWGAPDEEMFNASTGSGWGDDY